MELNEFIEFEKRPLHLDTFDDEDDEDLNTDEEDEDDVSDDEEDEDEDPIGAEDDE